MMAGLQTAHPEHVQVIQPKIKNQGYSFSFGPQIQPDGSGVLFRLWAPSAKQVNLVLPELNAKTLSMQCDDRGWFSILATEAEHGTLYQFQLEDGLLVPDPASRFQLYDVHGPSQVIDSALYSWRDEHWNGRPWEETILYELHVGSFTPEGTFQALKGKLDYLADLGITAIELMPVADFPGSRNWGYDGVLPYAPDSRYGTPDDLKDLIDTAHRKGLMVFLDVVYNHFGPDGNYLSCYAKSFFDESKHTPWGAAINFQGPKEVREFFIQNAFYWLNEYHFDGLRLDAVHAIDDSSSIHVLEELAARVRETIPEHRHVHLVLENDDNRSLWLREGYDAQWNDDFHHAAHVISTGDTTGYYMDYAEGEGKRHSHRTPVAHLGHCLTDGFAYQGEYSAYRHAERGESTQDLPLTAFVNFLQNHDQIGNRAFGERLNRLAPPEALRALWEIMLLSPSVPMLFMGEEWQASTPFLFFCDFNPELNKKVTEGRRKEFERFPQFSDPKIREQIPDPCALDTFEASRLKWDECDLHEHENWLGLCRRLLGLRQRDIVPHLAGAKIHSGKRNCTVFQTTGLHVQWHLGDGTVLQLLANLGAQPLTLPGQLLDNMDLGGTICFTKVKQRSPTF